MNGHADAVVIGSGPNGLVAANVLADRGWRVVVLEASAEPGGGARTGELTGEPGFRHDLFSAFHPFASVSPALAALDLDCYGLRWRHGPLAVAHPASDGSCVVLSRDLDETAASLDAFAPGDGDAWRRLYAGFQRVGSPLLEAMAAPMPPLTPALKLAATLGRDLPRFARFMSLPARRLVEEEFKGAGAARLLVGQAAHADLAPETPPSGALAWIATAIGQGAGVPTPHGGAGELTAALRRRLEVRGGEVRCHARVGEVLVDQGRARGVRTADGERVGAARAVLADVAVPALYRDLLARERLPARIGWEMTRFKYDLATFKLDWALNAPIPWQAEDTKRAGLVHLLDDVDEFTLAAAQLAMGLIPSKPFLVLGQYCMVDSTRSPAGTETAWVYTHLPRVVRGDAGGDLTGSWDEGEADAFAARIEARVEALAPGFRQLIRARHIFTPAGFEGADPNFDLGAMHGGTMQLHQQAIFRPTYSLGRPETPIRGLYLASASIHPGGGVHGGPGANAARAALLWDRAGTVARGLARARSVTPTTRSGAR